SEECGEESGQVIDTAHLSERVAVPDDIVRAVVAGQIGPMPVEDDPHVVAGDLDAFIDGKRLIHGALPPVSGLVGESSARLSWPPGSRRSQAGREGGRSRFA